MHTHNASFIARGVGGGEVAGGGQSKVANKQKKLKEIRAEEEEKKNLSPSAYQSSALPRGQTGSIGRLP